MTSWKRTGITSPSGRRPSIHLVPIHSPGSPGQAVKTPAAPAAIWRLWTDVGNWGSWNADIEKIELRGNFAAGGRIVMTPAGQDPVHLRIAELDGGVSFVDEADLGDVVVRTTHRLDALGDDRTLVTYRTEITGPAADEIGPRIGPAITADFPETMAALAKLAQR
jgi:Polyketide cyclase / dehydrase and lipid transport